MRDNGSRAPGPAGRVPAPEGARNPIERFEESFEGFDEETRDRFYRRHFEDMFAA